VKPLIRRLTQLEQAGRPKVPQLTDEEIAARIEACFLRDDPVVPQLRSFFQRVAKRLRHEDKLEAAERFRALAERPVGPLKTDYGKLENSSFGSGVL
jgi:hypothetical protein